MKNGFENSVWTVAVMAVVLVGRVCFGEDGQQISKVKSALLTKMKFENYWTGDWSERFRRELRIVTLDRMRYVVAFEVTTNDFPRSGDVSFQVAVVDFGNTWTVQYPGRPCSPDELLSGLLSVDGITKAEAESLRTGKGCIRTTFVFEKGERLYNHGKLWKSKTHALETELHGFALDQGLRSGVVLVNDLEDSDELFQGLALDERGEHCWRLSGELVKSDSLARPIYCRVRSELVQSVNIEDLARFMSAPLLWRVKTDKGKVVLSRDGLQWSRQRQKQGNPERRQIQSSTS